MSFLSLKVPSIIKRVQVKECAIILGLDESCLIASALCERAKKSGLVVYKVIYDSKTQGILFIEKNPSHPTKQHYQVRLDLSSSDAAVQFFKHIADACLTPQWIVHCPQRPAPLETLQMTPSDLESMWRVQGFSAFIFGQAAMKAILKNGVKRDKENRSPTIIFVGASDAVESQPNFSGFAAVKAGVRALAQSMAREFDPQGVHVAHVLLNHGDVVSERFAESVAATCWQIYGQPKQTWTQELELRSAGVVE
jgi:NAD(P)-dependent dehydrogenase (short-subunit alcohol dehydrogenase family)